MYLSSLQVIVTTVLLYRVEGHGRLLDPPGRASLWRFGYDAPANYDDNQLFCGGYGTLYSKNGGKCGICGDAYDAPQPRAHEAGGKYGLGIISRSYKVNDVITARVQITANHMGWFEFRLCANNNIKVDPEQECFDQTILELADGSGTRYIIPNDIGYTFVVDILLRLPKNLTCSQCILQWHYNTGNSWGVCENGEGRIGCGKQEVFRGCSDIEITT